MFKRIIIPTLKENINNINKLKNANNINNINKLFYTTNSNDTIINSSNNSNNSNNNNNNNNNNNDNDNNSNDAYQKLKLYREMKIKKKNFKNMVDRNEFQKIIDSNNTSNDISTTATSSAILNQKQEAKRILPKVDYNFKVEVAPGIFITPALSKVDKSSVIVTSSKGFEDEGKQVSLELGLDYLDLMQVLRLPNEIFTYQSVLFVSEKGVSLHDLEPELSNRNSNIRKLTSEIFLDYTSGSVHHRTEFGQNKKSPMIRSIKVNSKFPDHVMDVTGGLGKDAWAIASMGCRVTILERNPVLVYMIQKALEKARANSETSEIASRITLIHKDSIEYLVENIQTTDESLRPDVIYMDPMYPGKKKEKSLSKKDIRAVRRLVGGDRDSTLLFALARRFTKNRVSWKRPKEVVPLLGSVSEYKSSDTVFYVYLRKDLNDNKLNNDDNNNEQKL